VRAARAAAEDGEAGRSASTQTLLVVFPVRGDAGAVDLGSTEDGARRAGGWAVACTAHDGRSSSYSS
jgi:hypothetical protein